MRCGPRSVEDMTSTDEAMSSMHEAQALLKSVEADIERLREVVEWFTEAKSRVQALGDYIDQQAGDDRDAVFAHDPAAVTPPVANEDSAWEALAEFDLGTMRLLRVVTDQLTVSLDTS